MGRRKKNYRDILLNIYRDMYHHSTPQGDFDEILAKAELDSDGAHIIPYNEYEIDGDLMDNIIEMHMLANRLTKAERKIIKIHSYLGCSPKIKDNNE